MNIEDSPALTLEILIATMNRSNFDFLDKMFMNTHISDFKLLIINQSTKENALTSDKPNLIVINSLERGLPSSRNLAIDKASADICLLADDDVVYKKDFAQEVLDVFKKNPSADIITFQMENERGELFKNYPKIKSHDLETIRSVNSVVVAFDRKKIQEKNISFNPHFGLGSEFETGDEYVFLRNALQKKANIYFEPKVILTHPNFSSGSEAGSDRIIFARAALFYKYSGMLAYPRLAKYIYMNQKYGHIQKDDMLKKFKIGVQGIKKYKELLRLGFEEKD